MTTFSRIVAGVIILALALGGCTSRYRKDLFLTSGEERSKVKIVTTEYMSGVRLDNPYAERKVSPGAGSCLILTTESRGRTVQTEFLPNFVQFDENLICQVYLQLPASPEAEVIALQGNALVQIRGRYELSVEDKVFLPDSTGRLVVDSLSGDHLYASLHGRFTNHTGSSLMFDGEFRAKID